MDEAAKPRAAVTSGARTAGSRERPAHLEAP